MNNNPHKGLYNLYLILGIIVACIVIWQFIAPRFSNSGSTTIAGASTSTSQSDGGSTSPIADGDFTNSPGSITGPAIIEFWNGQGGANKVCGTFQLPSGQSFSYSPAGHWWQYKSDSDMQAEWSLHLKLYNQKTENAGCTNGQRPPS